MDCPGGNVPLPFYIQSIAAPRCYSQLQTFGFGPGQTFYHSGSTVNICGSSLIYFKILLISSKKNDVLILHLKFVWGKYREINRDRMSDKCEGVKNKHTLHYSLLARCILGNAGSRNHCWNI